MFHYKNRYVYTCDHCGKTLEGKDLTMHGNRYVGVDGDLMISISVSEDGVYHRSGSRQRTILLCPVCWGKVFRAVRRALKLEEQEGESK